VPELRLGSIRDKERGLFPYAYKGNSSSGTKLPDFVYSI
jgi:hypothetical protein